jgi:hypothetical protein
MLQEIYKQVLDPGIGRSSNRSLLLVHHVARRLAVSVRTVRHWAQIGKLPALRLQNTPKIWRFDPMTVEDFKCRRQP